MKTTDAERAAALVATAREQFAAFTALDYIHNLLGQCMGKNADESVSIRFLERLVEVQAAYQHLRDSLDAACEEGSPRGQRLASYGGAR